MRHPSPQHNPAQRVLEDGQAMVRYLLARYALLDPLHGAGPVLRAGVARRLCAELAAHMHVEEELLYPKLRAVLEDCSPLDQAEVEHECLRELMDRLMEMDGQDPMFDASVIVLGEIFDMHLQRESQQVFPLLQRSGLDLRTLG